VRFFTASEFIRLRERRRGSVTPGERGHEPDGVSGVPVVLDYDNGQEP
jgi:hypothetical protein